MEIMGKAVARHESQDDSRTKLAAANEAELRRAYMGIPGASEELWEQEKDSILAKDRADQAAKNRDAARRSQAGVYRQF